MNTDFAAMKHKHEDFKLAAVRYHREQGTSYVATCEIFHCSVRSLKRWIERFHQDGSIKRHNRQPKAYKVRQEHVDCAIQKVRRSKQIFVHQLLRAVQEDHPDFDISRRHLNRILLDSNYSRKRVRRKHYPARRRGQDVDHEAEMRAFFRQVDRFS